MSSSESEEEFKVKVKKLSEMGTNWGDWLEGVTDALVMKELDEMVELADEGEQTTPSPDGPNATDCEKSAQMG